MQLQQKTSRYSSCVISLTVCVAGRVILVVAVALSVSLCLNLEVFVLEFGDQKSEKAIARTCEDAALELPVFFFTNARKATTKIKPYFRTMFAVFLNFEAEFRLSFSRKNKRSYEIIIKYLLRQSASASWILVNRIERQRYAIQSVASVLQLVRRWCKNLPRRSRYRG